MLGKLLKYRIMFKDILTILGLDYRDATLITLYFFCPRNQNSKNQINGISMSYKKLKINMFKMDVWTMTFWLLLNVVLYIYILLPLQTLPIDGLISLIMKIRQSFLWKVSFCKYLPLITMYVQYRVCT